MGFGRVFKEKRPFLASCSEASAKAKGGVVEAEACDRPRVWNLSKRP